ncbi:MAG: hypothetical protein LBI63_04755 [Candidatus Ancillula sp.]|jgi:hypothetical protein|nr:hypothetical protein [Candidatus Ancillula sp.]
MDEKIRNSYNELLKSLDNDYDSLAPTQNISNDAKKQFSTPQNINQTNQFGGQFGTRQNLQPNAFGDQLGAYNNSRPVNSAGFNNSVRNQPSSQFQQPVNNQQQIDIMQTQSLGQPLRRKVPQLNHPVTNASVPMAGSAQNPKLQNAVPQSAILQNLAQPQVQNPQNPIGAANGQFANPTQATSQLAQRINIQKQPQNQPAMAQQFSPNGQVSTSQFAQVQVPRPQNQPQNPNVVRQQQIQQTPMPNQIRPVDGAGNQPKKAQIQKSLHSTDSSSIPSHQQNLNDEILLQIIGFKRLFLVFATLIFVAVLFLSAFVVMNTGNFTKSKANGTTTVQETSVVLANIRTL